MFGSSVSSRRKTSFARIACVALTAAFLATALYRAAALHAEFGTADCASIEVGESLLHGAAGRNVSWNMPLSSLRETHCRHLSAAGRIGVSSYFFGLSLFLVFTLAYACFGLRAGIISAFLSLSVLGWGFSETAWETASLLAIANAAVLFARSPSVYSGSWLGGFFALSWMLRSTLAPLPFLFLGLVVLTSKKSDRDESSLWPVVAIPFVVLLPWIILNGVSTDRFVPFEFERAYSILATGALGLIPGIDGDFRAVADVTQGSGVMGWALGEMLAHPLRTGGAWWGRFLAASGEHPFLLLGAAAAVFRHRDRIPVRYAAYLAIYLLLVPCLLSIELRYFDPLWALCAALAGGVFLKAGGDEESLRWLRAGLRAYGVPMTLGLLGALSLSYSYPVRREPEPIMLTREISRYPRDPWLLHNYGDYLMSEGRAGEAVRFYAHAAKEDPKPFRVLAFAWAKMVLGEKGEDLILRVRPPASAPQRAGYYLLRAIHSVGKGDEKSARLFLNSARSDWRLFYPGFPSWKKPLSPRAEVIRDKMREKDESLGRALRRLLIAWPQDKRRELSDGWLRLLNEEPYVVVDLAEIAALKGDEGWAKRAIARFDAGRATVSQRVRAAGVYGILALPHEGLSLLGSVSEDKRTAEFYLRYSALAEAGGDGAAAQRAFAKAAGFYREPSDLFASPYLGLEIVRKKYERHPRRAKEWGLLAQIANRAGFPAAAREARRRENLFYSLQYSVESLY